MNRTRLACFVLIGLFGLLWGGCTPDAQVWVTPYVPKQYEPAGTAAAGQPPADYEPCTRAYEEAVAAR